MPWPADAVVTNDQVRAQFLNSTWKLIDSTDVGASTNSVTYSPIPQNYRHLFIAYDFETATGDTNASVRLNSDSGANYSVVSIRADTAAGTVSLDYSFQFANTNQATMGRIDAGGRATGWVTIFDYSATDRYKLMDAHIFTARDYSTSGSVTRGQTWLGSTMWQSTAAVTSVTVLSLDGYNFSTSDTLRLYAMGAK